MQCDTEWDVDEFDFEVLGAFGVKEVDRVKYIVHISKIDIFTTPSPQAETVAEMGISNGSVLTVEFSLREEVKVKKKKEPSSAPPLKPQPCRKSKDAWMKDLSKYTEAYEELDEAKQKEEQKRQAKNQQANERRRQREATGGGERGRPPQIKQF